ncbi:sulfotransferase [Halothece sp. PCC 7418]|uniref:sulfotransferase domain-containing protein n=1 Tax=Halothece sp. (strain PCC 7418) TaxID=65093 RepID=UPI0002A060AC|nr:sulfotransferase domain-containing protein [Halothece sp. PCC 7418]AFZ43496.1 sulfotransferase [Halothece sp. PCC 7418]
MNIVWLASYPKSGNTFLRLLLYRYIYADVMDRTKEVEDKVPDVHKLISEGKKLNVMLDGSVLVKSHFLLSSQHPYFSHTVGFIYILRNPRDVIFSNARYFGLSKDQDSLHSFVENFIKNKGVDRWTKMGMGTYLGHLTSWLNGVNSFPHLFIKYENLKEKPIETLTNVINFLGIEIDKNKMQEVIEDCDINKLREIEIQEKQNNETTVFHGSSKGEYFIGQGKTNQSLAEISKDLEHLYQENFERFVRIFGY